MVGVDGLLARLEVAEATQVHRLSGAESADDHPTGRVVGRRGERPECGIAAEVDEVVEHVLDGCPGTVGVPEGTHRVAWPARHQGLVLLGVHRSSAGLSRSTW